MMKKEIKGIIALIFLTFLYGLYGIFSRILGNSFGAFSQNFIINLMGFLIFGFIFFLGKRKNIQKKDWWWVFGWLLSGSIIMPFEFMIFNHLKIGIFYFLSESTMIIGGFIFGGFLFNEKINLVKLTSILLSIFGLFLIFSISFENKSEIVYIFGSLICGLIISFWNVVSKKFSENYSNNQLIFLLCFSSLIISGIGLLLTREKVPLFDFSFNWLMIFIFGFVQVLAVNLAILSFKYLEILPLEIVFAIILSFLFFGETISFTGSIGGILIIMAAVLPNVFNLLKIKIKK